MKMIKAFCIAFSMYSKIPMPQFPWKEEDMRYCMLFFPFVGAVIGGLEWGLFWLRAAMSMENVTYTLLATALPILISGGFHVDGYMDTQDALHSYQSKERKLEILKDAHIGAFAVIRVLLYYMLFAAGVAQVSKGESFFCLCAGFVLSRALSAVAMFTFPLAKKEGSLAGFAKNGKKNVVLFGLGVEIAVTVLATLWTSPLVGAAVCGGMAVTFGYYYWKSKKEFGGITGDLAGYFVTLAELMTVLICMVFSLI